MVGLLSSKKKLLIYILWLVLDGFNYYAFSAFITLYLHQSQGLSYQHAYTLYGILISLSYVVPLLSGLLADRVYGSPPVLIVSIFVMLVGYLLLDRSGKINFTIGSILFLFGSGGLKCMVYKLLSELCTIYSDKSRDRIFSIFYAIYNLGAIISAMILGFFIDQGQWEVMFFVGIVASVRNAPKITWTFQKTVGRMV